MNTKEYLRRYAAETTKPWIPIARYLDGQMLDFGDFEDNDLAASWKYVTYLIGAGLRSRGETTEV